MPGSRDHLPGSPHFAAGTAASIGSATLVEAKICLGYTAILLLALGAGDVAEAAARWWIRVSSIVTDALLFLVPVPLEPPGHPYEIAVYRHVLAASILLTVIIFLALRRHWTRWGRRAGMIVEHMSSRQEGPVELAQVGYSRMALGAAATILLMLYGDQHLGSLTETLYAQPWTFLRAPLFAILAFTLACHAAALRCMCSDARRMRSHHS